MRTLLLNAALIGCATLLSGCLSTDPGTNVFSFSPPPAEVTLTQSVQNALMNTGDPVLAQVRVQTNQAHVVLSGYVKKIRQSDTAEQVAHKVPGVQTVENRLIVRQ